MNIQHNDGGWPDKDWQQIQENMPVTKWGLPTIKVMDEVPDDYFTRRSRLDQFQHVFDVALVICVGVLILALGAAAGIVLAQ